MHLRLNNTSYRISPWLLVLLIVLAKSIFLLISFYSYRPTIITYSIMTIWPTVFLFAFAFLFNLRGKLVYLFILDLIISLIYITDAIYFRAFDHIISVYMIFAEGVTEDLGSSILSLIQWHDFLFLIDLPFIYLLFFHSRYFAESSKAFRVRFIQFFILAVMSVSLIAFLFENQVEDVSLCNPAIHPLTMSPLGAHMFDIYRYVYERTAKLEIDDVEAIRNWFAENKQYHKVDTNHTHLEGIISGKNLVVIQFESLENILIGHAVNGQEITPNINRLMENSIYFNNIYEQTRDGNSSDAELLFNTSLYPLERGSAFLRFGDNTFPAALPHLLSENGYNAVAIHGDNKEFWNRDRAFRSLGFDKYISEEDFDNKEKLGMGILDEYLFEESFREIKQLDGPYYLFIITVTAHMPFNPPANFDSINLPADDYTSQYLKCINYTDGVFGQFYDQMEKAGFWDNSVLIIYGDHEGVHKYYPTNLPDNGKRIPFIVHAPGIQGQIVKNVGGQVDMMPTLAYLLGIDGAEYSNEVMGRNLFAPTPGAALLSDGSLVGNRDSEDHLAQAHRISDLIIRGNYFGVVDKQTGDLVVK